MHENSLKILSAWVKALKTNPYQGKLKRKRGRYRGLTHFNMGFLAGFVTGTLGRLPDKYISKAFKRGYQAIWWQTMLAWKALEDNSPHNKQVTIYAENGKPIGFLDYTGKSFDDRKLYANLDNSAAKGVTALVRMFGYPLPHVNFTD